MTVKISKWVNAKGLNIELHTEHVTEETSTTDWNQVLVKKVDRIRIEKVLVEGKEYNSMIGRTTIQNTKVLDLGKNYSTRTSVYLALPADVERDVWGAFDARQAEKYEVEKLGREIAAVQLAKKEANGYCSKCGSYCHGDCR